MRHRLRPPSMALPPYARHLLATTVPGALTACPGTCLSLQHKVACFCKNAYRHLLQARFHQDVLHRLIGILLIVAQSDPEQRLLQLAVMAARGLPQSAACMLVHAVRSPL